MTIAEAKAIIYANVVYACEKAGFEPQTTRLVQDACDTIIALAERKTEPITHDDYIESENDYLEARCLNCENSGSYKCTNCDGEMYFKVEPQSNILLDAMAKAFGIETEPLTLKGGEDVHEFCKKCGESKARLIDGERYIVCGKASDLVCVSIKECPLGKWVCEDTYIIMPQTERSE